VIPRLVGQSMNFHGRQRADAQTLEATAARIRASLAES
jgi:hypothetical protein